ncbi:T9SS C-terminal target domain-containing protein [Chryseobacterium arthrosphaerae]|uniref:T9SS type A sorting domain-containing protein n=1 Tax=Chryseobacterium arthrosphaerae TaxID=651561 RepID=A0A3S0N5W2_9FLAO|nr:T9SS type A sorting domain-containing protein [Chryseobacterium arthrosphaerae]AYZ13661.1 T9SS C-terminal target domain-containing protein [Chryseobacterium arthrosphaerae]RTZ49836.1 T9SS type A sorting domain-containing protein [Chryseobacterium arthrosphaerae]WET00383.1 T9SS type A sorting domain-containing protein [Chryseobacterium arthrosphaerae]
MKKLYSLVAVAMFAATSFAQTTIYSENLGAGGNGVAITSYNGWENASPIVYSGTSDVRNTTTSSGYAGASGAGNILFNASSDTFIISGIDTSAYTDIQLSLGHFKATSASSNEVAISVSTDGTNWTPLSYTRPTGSNTSNWILITPTGNIPSTTNLSIKFDSSVFPTTNPPQMRIDDIKLTGTSITLGTSNVNKSKNVFIKNTVVNNDITFGAKSDVKVFNMAGQVVKTASVSENQSLNVSDLQQGTYIVTGTVNGKNISEKVIKK